MDVFLGAQPRAGPTLLKIALSGLLCAAALLAGCRVDLDPEQPIALVPGDGWSEDQLALLRQAANSWNLELGTRVLVERAPPAEQQVALRRSALVCGYYGALTRHDGEVTVDICELLAERPERLFETARHEIGHVLGIGEHAGDQRAVMSTGSFQRYFRPEDHRLFFSANPEFVGQGGCAMARQVGGATTRLALAQARDAAPYLAWAEADAVHLAPLEASQLPGADAALTISTPRRAGWLAAAATPGAIVLVWSYGDDQGLMATRVTQAAAAGPIPLALAPEQETIRWQDAAVLALQHDLLLAAPVEQAAGRQAVRLARLDPASGQQRPWQLPRLETSWVQAAARGDGALLLYPEGRDTLLLEVAGDGSALRELRLPQPADEGQLVLLASQPDQALIALRSGVELQLYRLALVPEPRILDSASLALPGPPSSLPGLSLLEAGGSVYLALAALSSLGSEEINLLEIPLARLADSASWRPISALDLTHSVRPLLAAGADGQLLVVWRELHLKDMQIRSRCIAPYAESSLSAW